MPSTTLDRSEFDSIPDTIKAFRTYKSHAYSTFSHANTKQRTHTVLYRNKAPILTNFPTLWQAMDSS